MPSQAWLQGLVCFAALIAAIVSFLVYALLALNVVKPSSQQEIEQNAAKARGFAPPDPAQAAELIKALASLATSLAKAGPALWSLISSALFLLIAALAAGVFQSAPRSDTAVKNTAHQNSSASDSNSAAGQDNGSDNPAPSNENLPVH